MKINCPNCSANIKFIPSYENCFCEHCNKIIKVSEIIYENLRLDYDEFICSTCGARLVLNENNISTNCIYCGSNQILVKKLEKEFKPDSILPFKLDKEKAIECCKKFILNHNKFFDKNMVLHINDENLFGIYVPYYVYTWRIELYIDGHKEEFSYQDIEVIKKDGSTKYDDNIMKLLQNFDMENIKKFHPAYILGFNAEVPNEIYFNRSQEKTIVSQKFYDKPNYQEALKKLNKINEKFPDSKATYDIDLIKRETMLLPVWFVKVKNSSCTFAINGRTGVVSSLIYTKKGANFVFDNLNKDVHRENDVKFRKTFFSKLLKILINLVTITFIVGITYYIYIMFKSIPGI